MGNLLLPTHLCLSINLSSRLKLLSFLTQQNSAGDDRIITHNRLVMVNMSSAIWAVVAVDCFAYTTQRISRYSYRVSSDEDT